MNLFYNSYLNRYNIEATRHAVHECISVGVDDKGHVLLWGEVLDVVGEFDHYVEERIQEYDFTRKT